MKGIAEMSVRWHAKWTEKDGAHERFYEGSYFNAKSQWLKDIGGSLVIMQECRDSTSLEYKLCRSDKQRVVSFTRIVDRDILLSIVKKTDRDLEYGYEGEDIVSREPLGDITWESALNKARARANEEHLGNLDDIELWYEPAAAVIAAIPGGLGRLYHIKLTFRDKANAKGIHYFADLSLAS